MREQIIERTIDLIDAGWTSGAYARNRDGKAVAYHAKDATCFCTVGAVYRAVHDVMGFSNLTYSTNLIREIKDEIGEEVERYNDHVAKSKEEMIEILNKVKNKVPSV